MNTYFNYLLLKYLPNLIVVQAVTKKVVSCPLINKTRSTISTF